MTVVILAALSGLVWGTGDFAGGKASQRASSLVSTIFAKALSVPVLLGYLFLLSTTLHPVVLLWGAGAGVFGVLGMIVFYRGLASGAMSVVAPVSAVTSALIPLAVGLVIQRAPGWPALVGAGVAIAAIAMVSAAPRVPDSPVNGKLIGLALGSGVAFGLFFVGLGEAGAAAHGHAGLWPVLAAHSASLLVGAVLLARARCTQPGLMRITSAVTWGWLAISGVFDMTANVLYLLAVQGGLLSIVAPVASLYPVTTVLLAMAVDRERMRPVQLAGLGLAATALVLVAS